MSDAPTPQLAPTRERLFGEPVDDTVNVLGQQRPSWCGRPCRTSRYRCRAGRRGSPPRPPRGFRPAPTSSRSRRLRRRLPSGPRSARRRPRPPSRRSARRAARAVRRSGRPSRQRSTLRPALSATARAISAAFLLSSYTRPARCAASGVARAAERIGEDDVGAGVDKALVQLGDRLGRGLVQSSGASPASSPIANRLVPVAPSARRTPFSAIRASIGLVMHGAFTSWNEIRI